MHRSSPPTSSPRRWHAPAQFGAITVDGGADQVEQIRDLTGGRGVDAVFDFVGAAPTIEMAQATVAQRGAMQIVGIAGGMAQWNFFTNPYEATLTNSYWGTIEDLHEVVELYRPDTSPPTSSGSPSTRPSRPTADCATVSSNARAVVVPHG